ncbi:MAG: DUF5119 domain-containing protein [Bacteroidales bacterium]|nr:DUF5119 domain-containing protein [Bacteroidales bacterium]
MRITVVPAIVLCAALSCVACERRPLLRTEYRILLELRVHDTVAPVVRSAVEGLWQHRFFDLEAGRTAGSAYTGPEGGEIDVMPGSYAVVSHNFGTETVVFEGEGELDLLRACTNVAHSLTRSLERIAEEVGTKAPALSEAGDVVWEPDMLYGALVPRVDVPVRSPEDPELVIRSDAWPLVKSCRLVVSGVTGQQYLAGASCFLSGISRGRSLGSGELDSVPSTIFIPLDPVPQEGTLEAGFRTFGFPDGASNPLHLLLTDTGGGRYLFPFDVTEQCDNSVEPLVIHVDLDFEIPEPGHGGGGLAPVLGGWTVIDHPVNL